MNSQRWARVNELFFSAVRLPPEQRRAHLDATCGDDVDLRAEIERLLVGDAETDESFLAPISPLTSLDAAGQLKPDPYLGRRVGHYEIGSLLGVGGMGRVYLGARFEDYSQQVAIKFLRRELGSDDFVRRFHNEVQFQAELGTHPNIAALIDAGVTDDDLRYLVMEYVDGQEIDRFCDEEKLPIEDRLRLFLRVCEAVQFAHQHAVIHRDLKPSNILVPADGTPKLIDFGIAKLLRSDNAEDSADHTQTIDRALTPHYASPEHVKGQALTTASDVYSLGVVLYQLLTGRRPYRLTNMSAAEVERIVCEKEPVRPSTAVARRESVRRTDGSTLKLTPELLGARCSQRPQAMHRQLAGDVDNIVLKALCKEPQLRYQSAHQLAADIHRHLEGLPVEAHLPSWRYRCGKFVRRNRGAVVAAGLVLATLMVGIVGTTTQWLDARDNAATAMKANLELQANQQKQRQQLYVAHMNLVQQAWESGSLARMTDLLNRHATPSGGEDLRGFEWYYWKQMCQRFVVSHRCAEQPMCIAVSPQADIAAVGEGNGNIEIWDLAARNRLHVLSEHESSVNAVAISHDGRLLASASNDRSIRLWNLESGQAVHVLKGHNLLGVGVAFSADDRRLVSAGGRWNQPGEVIMWDTLSGEQLAVDNAHDDYLKCLAISPDGSTWATGGWDHRVVLWDAALGSPIGDLGKHDSAVFDVEFAPDGKTLVSASADHTLKLWNVSDRELKFALSGHAGVVECVCYSPDGDHVVSGGGDGVVKVWNAETGQLQATVVGHAREVTGVAFDRSGRTLMTASADGTLKQWNLADVLDGPVLRGHERAIYALAFSPDGKTLVSGGYDSTLRFWDVKSREQTAQVGGEFGRVTSVAFSDDGAYCYSGHRAGGTNLRKWAVGKEQVSLSEIPLDQNVDPQKRPSKRSVEAAALSPDGNLIALAQWGAEIAVWNTSTWQSNFLWKQQVGVPSSIAFSPDGAWLATTSNDRVVRILNSTTGQIAAELQGHTDSTTSVAFSPDGKVLASGSADRTIRLWNTETHQLQHTLRGHNGGVLSVAFAPDGTTLASGGADAAVKLWDLDTGEKTTTLAGHTRAVTSVRFSPDGTILASASEDSTIRLWLGW